MSTLRQLVFLSYSHEPGENASFVRELARTLRASGFDPWLDEERIAGATNFEAEIRGAIKEARHALFVVTRRWLEREYTRMELNLFNKKDPGTHYRVAINREGIDPDDFAPQLQRLHVIDWRADDPLPDARTWEVYAALTRRPPGPRDEWPEKGRRLIVARDAPARPDPPAEDAPKTAPDPAVGRLPCAARPALAVPAGESTVVLTEGPECFRVGPGPIARPLPPLQPWAAASASDGSVVAALYNRMLVRLRGDDWEYRSLEATPLSVAGGGQGASVGDSAGGVTLYPPGGSRPTSIPFGEPVAELLATDDGVLALGPGGRIGRACWDDPARGFEAIAVPEGMGTASGFFRPHDPGGVGIGSGEAVAVLDLDSGRVRVGNARFPEGVRLVVPIGRQAGHFVVLTDSGRLYYHELTQKQAAPIRLPVEPAEVVGACRVGTSGVLAWTSGGSLFFVAHDRTVRNLGVEDVALACPDPSAAGQVQLIRRVEGRGLLVQLIRPDQAR